MTARAGALMSNIIPRYAGTTESHKVFYPGAAMTLVSGPLAYDCELVTLNETAVSILSL